MSKSSIFPKRSTFELKNTEAYPRVHVDTGRVAALGQAGGFLLTEPVRATELDTALSDALAPWRKPHAVHDPGKVVLVLAIALGGDALSDIGALRGEPGVHGRIAYDPTVSRTIAALASDSERAIAAINTARQAARSLAWALAGEHAPDHAASAKNPLIIDLDAMLFTAQSEKAPAKPTFMKGFGFHPLCTFADHGPAGTGETLAMKLRPGNAGSNTATDHIDVVKQALAQLPDANPRPGKKVLIRADGGGGTKEFIA